MTQQASALERSPALLTPGEWHVGITLDYDTVNSYNGAAMFGRAIHIDARRKVILDEAAAAKLAADLAPEDAIPGTIDLVVDDSVLVAPKTPYVLDNTETPRYAIDPRKTPSDRYKTHVIQHRTGVAIPSDMTTLSTKGWPWQEKRVQRRIADSIVFATKLRSEQSIIDALVATDTSRRRMIGLAAGTLTSDAIASAIIGTLSQTEFITVAGVGAASIGLLYETAKEEAESRTHTALTPGVLAHVQSRLYAQARREVKQQLKDATPVIASIPRTPVMGNRQKGFVGE